MAQDGIRWIPAATTSGRAIRDALLGRRPVAGGLLQAVAAGGLCRRDFTS
jgi:hypothetical protein